MKECLLNFLGVLFMKINKVQITEIGPRDDFQSKTTILKAEDKMM